MLAVGVAGFALLGGGFIALVLARRRRLNFAAPDLTQSRPAAAERPTVSVG